MTGSIRLHGRSKTIFLYSAFVLVVLSILLSAGIFVADRYAAVAANLLDDPETGYRDMIDLSEETLAAYQEAILAYEKARVMSPLNADYAASLAGLYHRVDVWREAMKDMDSMVGEGLLPEKEARVSSFRYMRRALVLDPADPNHRLAFGQMEASIGNRDAAREELMNAVDAYPVNAPLRYAVLMQLLMAGDATHACEQAEVLARIDDSYRLADDDPQSLLTREQRPPGYERQLENSYLSKAMEVTWRTSGQDPKAVRAIVPDQPDAQLALRLFLEHKNIDVN